MPRMRNQILKIGFALLVAFSTLGFTSTATPDTDFHSWHFSDLFKSHENLWISISHDFQLNNEDTSNYYVGKQVRWFRKQQYYLFELTRNAQPYIYYVLQQVRKRGMPSEIALMPMIESNYNPFNPSRRGAVGLWQIMPGTASGFGLTINWWYDGRRDVVASTNAALNYLQYLHDYFHDWLLAIAAYDSGEGRIIAAIRYNRRHHRPTDFWSLPLPYETKTYVPKLLALADIIKNHSDYGLRLIPVDNKPFFSTLTLKTQMPLEHLAKLSSTSTKLIRYLNPGFRRWATMPDHTYHFLVPIDKAQILRNRLAAGNHHTLPHTNPSGPKWLYHSVNSGESLSVIAEKYKTSVHALRKTNKLSHKTLRIGQNLLIPVASSTSSFKRMHDRKIAEDHVPGPQRIDYIIRPGDTIAKIAHRYHITNQDIYFWNSFSKNTRLQKNEKIVIWKPSQHYYSHHSKNGFRHRVRSGESLGSLAHRYGTSISHIKHTNHLTGNSIRIGQRLYIN